MKRTNIIQDLYALVKVTMHFTWQHHAALTILTGVYCRSKEATQVDGNDATLSIRSEGSIYRVSRKAYNSNKLTEEACWLATYSWGGHLIEIGGWRCCFIETVSKSIYLKTLTDEGEITLELFIKKL